MWTGFSVISMYAYGKQFFRRNQNQKMEEANEVNEVNEAADNNFNKKRAFIKKKSNDKLS